MSQTNISMFVLIIQAFNNNFLLSAKSQKEVEFQRVNESMPQSYF